MLATYEDITCALTTDHEIICFCDNIGYEYENCAIPKNGEKYMQICLGDRWACGLKLNNEGIECWGEMSGSFQNSLRSSDFGSNVHTIMCTGAALCVLTHSGGIQCLGKTKNICFFSLLFHF